MRQLRFGNDRQHTRSGVLPSLLLIAALGCNPTEAPVFATGTEPLPTVSPRDQELLRATFSNLNHKYPTIVFYLDERQTTEWSLLSDARGRFGATQVLALRRTAATNDLHILELRKGKPTLLDDPSVTVANLPRNLGSYVMRQDGSMFASDGPLVPSRLDALQQVATAPNLDALLQETFAGLFRTLVDREPHISQYRHLVVFDGLCNSCDSGRRFLAIGESGQVEPNDWIIAIPEGVDGAALGGSPSAVPIVSFSLANQEIERRLMILNIVGISMPVAMETRRWLKGGR